jgi:hypothetical protein
VAGHSATRHCHRNEKIRRGASHAVKKQKTPEPEAEAYVLLLLIIACSCHTVSKALIAVLLSVVSLSIIEQSGNILLL